MISPQSHDIIFEAFIYAETIVISNMVIPGGKVMEELWRLFDCCK